MASAAQVVANRSNAKNSTGPATSKGKARSASNSLKHGLTASFEVLAHEDAREFDEMYEGYLAEFAPEGYHETYLVQQMVQARWRVLRCRRLEAAWFNSAAELEDAPALADAAILRNMHDKGADVPSALHRYAVAAERSYLRHHKELMAGRKESGRTSQEARELAMYDYIYAPMPSVRTAPPPSATTKLRNEPNFPPAPPKPASGGKVHPDLGELPPSLSRRDSRC